MVQGKTILVVDDEPRMIEFIRMNLELEGYGVSSASGGYEAIRKVAEEIPDLILLDIMMPEMDGFEVLQRIREMSSVPVIILSVKGEEWDRVRGLDLGADDYITKPFSSRELLSRIRAVLRRVEMEPPVPRAGQIVVDDSLTIDFDRRRVVVRGRELALRPTEYRLLYHLVSNAGRVLTHRSLLTKVWGPEYRDEDHYVRLYITYLRQKIEDDPRRPRYILNERGIGYRFMDFRRG